MLPFFDGLIPEGWLLQIAIENWKLNSRDRMSLLLTLCKDCIGDISIVKKEKK
jgi:serine/threonine-protein kinase HipA